MHIIFQYFAFFIFALLAGGHWYRYFMDIPVMFGDFAVPVMWSSPIAGFFTFMAVWALYACKCSSESCK